MNELQPDPAISAADPATSTETPTLTLTERLTQMSEDIRVQMESCGKDPAGRLERAWLRLFLMLYCWLARLAGEAVPAWMEEACRFERRSRLCRAKGEASETAPDTWPGDSRIFRVDEPPDPISPWSEDVSIAPDNGRHSVLARTNGAGCFETLGVPCGATANTACVSDAGAPGCARHDIDTEITPRGASASTGPRRNRQFAMRDACARRAWRRLGPIRLWTATTLSVRHC